MPSPMVRWQRMERRHFNGNGRLWRNTRSGDIEWSDAGVTEPVAGAFVFVLPHKAAGRPIDGASSAGALGAPAE